MRAADLNSPLNTTISFGGQVVAALTYTDTYLSCSYLHVFLGAVTFCGLNPLMVDIHIYVKLCHFQMKSVQLDRVTAQLKIYE
jgi:phosphatidate phosphatase PAH1